jgi:hypothetical protein
MKSMLLFAIIAPLFLLISCEREKVNCHKPAFKFTFTGYAANQVDTVIVTEYLKGTNFGTAKNVVALNAVDHFFTVKNDSISLNYSPFSQTSDEIYDIEIRNKFDNNLIRLYQIEYDIKTTRANRFDPGVNNCESPIKSYLILGNQMVESKQEIFIAK